MKINVNQQLRKRNNLIIISNFIGIHLTTPEMGKKAIKD